MRISNAAQFATALVFTLSFSSNGGATSLSAYDDAGFAYKTSVSYFCGYSASPCVGTVPLPNTSLVANYGAWAAAPAYGVYKAYGSMSLAPGAATTGAGFVDVFAGGVAVSDDTLTFLGQPAGTPGIFIPIFTVSGSSSITPGNVASYSIWVHDFNDNTYYTIAAGRGVPTNPAIPITFGVPIHLQTNFDAQATIVALAPGSSAVANYSDTAVLSKILLLDENGHALPVEIQSASGTVYTSSGILTPEPSEFALFSFGVLGLGLRRLRKA